MNEFRSDRMKIVGLLAVVVALAIGLAYVVRQNGQLRLRSATNLNSQTNTAPTNSATILEPQTFVDETGSIRITNMRANQSLPSGFVVKGTAVAFESRFAWRLLDGKGHAIASGFVTSQQPDVGIPGPYEFLVTYNEALATTTGTLMLLEPSAKDGSDTHVVRVPIWFPPRS